MSGQPATPPRDDSPGSSLSASAAFTPGDTALGAFLEQLADGTPAPAGGAACGVTVAMAAALAGMAARVTARRADDPARWRAIAVAADERRDAALALAAEDAEAYRAVIEAKRDPVRPDVLAAALRRATEVPVEIARTAAAVLTLADTVAPAVRRAVAGDLAVAVRLALAGLDSAVATARVNLQDLSDPAFAAGLAQQLDAHARDSAVIAHRAIERLEHREPPVTALPKAKGA